MDRTLPCHLSQLCLDQSGNVVIVAAVSVDDIKLKGQNFYLPPEPEPAVSVGYVVSIVDIDVKGYNSYLLPKLAVSVDQSVFVVVVEGVSVDDY